jgi:hypothetical protein
VARAVTLTGNGVKAFAILLRSAGNSGSSTIGLHDDTAAAWRARASYTVAANGVITAGAIDGSVLGVEAIGEGVYRILMASTSCTAANTHSAYANASGGATLASAYVGGVQVEDAAVPSSLIPTTSAAVTRSADALSFPFNVPPRAMTVYVKIVERGTALLTGSNGVLGVGATVAPAFMLLVDGSGHYRWEHRNGSDLSSTAAAAPSLGQTVELRGILNADGSAQLGQSINSAAEVVASATAANALGSAWNNMTLVLNDWASEKGFGAFVAVRFAAGVQTMAYMREG